MRPGTDRAHPRVPCGAATSPQAAQARPSLSWASVSPATGSARATPAGSGRHPARAPSPRTSASPEPSPRARGARPAQRRSRPLVARSAGSSRGSVKALAGPASRVTGGVSASATPHLRVCPFRLRPPSLTLRGVTLRLGHEDVRSVGGESVSAGIRGRSRTPCPSLTRLKLCPKLK